MKGPASFDQGLFLMHLHKGKEYFDQNQLQKAREELEAAYHLRPQDEKVLNMLGMAYYKLEMLPQAEEMYVALASNNPDIYTLQSNLGLIRLKLDKLDMAKESLSRALELQPTNPKAHFYLGLLSEKLENWGEALNHFQSAKADKMIAKMQAKLEEVKAVEMPLPFEVLRVLAEEHDQAGRDIVEQNIPAVSEVVATAEASDEEPFAQEPPVQTQVRYTTQDMNKSVEVTAKQDIVILPEDDEVFSESSPFPTAENTERLKLQQLLTSVSQSESVDEQELVEDEDVSDVAEEEKDSASIPDFTAPWEKTNSELYTSSTQPQEDEGSDFISPSIPTVNGSFFLAEETAADISTFLAESRVEEPRVPPPIEDSPFVQEAVSPAAPTDPGISAAWADEPFEDSADAESTIPTPEEVENQISMMSLPRIADPLHIVSDRSNEVEATSEAPEDTLANEQQESISSSSETEEASGSQPETMVEDSVAHEEPVTATTVEETQEEALSQTDREILADLESPVVAITPEAHETVVSSDQAESPADGTDLSEENVVFEGETFAAQISPGEMSEPPTAQAVTPEIDSVPAVTSEPVAESVVEEEIPPNDVEIAEETFENTTAPEELPLVAAALSEQISQKFLESQDHSKDETQAVTFSSFLAPSAEVEELSPASEIIHKETPSLEMPPSVKAPEPEMIYEVKEQEAFQPANLEQFSRERHFIPPLIGSDRFVMIDPHLLEIVISQKLICRIGTISSYTGNLQFSSWMPEREESLIQVDGSGIVFVADRRKEIFLLSLTNETAFVETSHLLVAQSALRVEPYVYEQKGIAGRFSFLKISGRGTFAVTCHTRPLTMTVHDAQPASIPAEALIAWSGRLNSSLIQDEALRKVLMSPEEGAIFLRFSGSGNLVIEQGSLWGDRRAKR